MMPIGLLLKFGGPLLLIVGLLWYHNNAVGAVEKQRDTALTQLSEKQDELTQLKIDMVEAAQSRNDAVAQALIEAQGEWERVLGQEREVREASQALARRAQRERLSAERQLEELKNENQDVRDWGDTIIPSPWLDWMRQDFSTDEGLPTPGDGDSAGATVTTAPH